MIQYKVTQALQNRHPEPISQSSAKNQDLVNKKFYNRNTNKETSTTTMTALKKMNVKIILIMTNIVIFTLRNGLMAVAT